jgi:hypothetical protein
VSEAHCGRALCIGVDTTGESGAGAEADARALSAIAGRQGFLAPTLLLGAAATRETVRAKIREAAAACKAGDLFLLTFSGHGGRKCAAVATGAAGAAESAGATGVAGAGALRAVWVLYDGALDDAEMHRALAAFRAGVRVLVVSDSCNGGVPAARSPNFDSPVAASVLVLTACQNDQYADGGGLPGHFTTALVHAWQGGQFTGGYRNLHEALVARMPAYQKPSYYWVGPSDQRFEAQRPFTI